MIVLSSIHAQRWKRCNAEKLCEFSGRMAVGWHRKLFGERNHETGQSVEEKEKVKENKTIKLGKATEYSENEAWNPMWKNIFHAWKTGGQNL